MKIRRYKGSSLNKLYEVIEEELGPEAVVVTTRRPRGVNAFLAPLLGGESYELLAVVDDQAAEKHCLSDTARREDLKQLSQLHSRKWEQMENAVRELRGDLGHFLRGGQLGPEIQAENIPPFARNWDQEFLKALRQKDPLVFDRNDQYNACREMLRKSLNVEEHFPVKKEKKPHIVVLTGPTGAGKTTTLAKLAARWSLDQKLKVGLTSTDTYRVAAVDQIKEYATLLGLELKVAFSATEAARAVKTFEDKDVILVDTPGRSLYDQAGLTGLRGVLQSMGPVTVLMLLPATTDGRNVAEIISRFQILNINYLVITKMDETRHYDLLTAAAYHTACPVAFITDGQRVPQDLHTAQASELINWLVPQEQCLVSPSS